MFHLLKQLVMLSFAVVLLCLAAVGVYALNAQTPVPSMLVRQLPVMEMPVNATSDFGKQVMINAKAFSGDAVQTFFPDPATKRAQQRVQALEIQRKAKSSQLEKINQELKDLNQRIDASDTTAYPLKRWLPQQIGPLPAPWAHGHDQKLPLGATNDVEKTTSLSR